MPSLECAHDIELLSEIIFTSSLRIQDATFSLSGLVLLIACVEYKFYQLEENDAIHVCPQLFYGKPEPVWEINSRRRNMGVAADPYYPTSVASRVYSSRGTSHMPVKLFCSSFKTPYHPVSFGHPHSLKVAQPFSQTRA